MLAVALEVNLQRAGHIVLGPVAHLDAALAALTAPRIDAALLDVHLSRGAAVYPVADRLEELRIPFGFMTAYQTDHIAARYSKRPIVRKPCSEADLLELVNELLANSGTADPVGLNQSGEAGSSTGARGNRVFSRR